MCWKERKGERESDLRERDLGNCKNINTVNKLDEIGLAAGIFTWDNNIKFMF